MGGTVDGPLRPPTVVDTPPVTDHAPSTPPATPPSADTGSADPSAVFKKRAEATFAGIGIKAKLANMDGTDRHSTVQTHSWNFKGMAEFQALPAEVRNRLSDPALEQQLSRLVETRLYSGLTTEQGTKLLNVFAAADPQGREELITLMGRKLPSGQSALLSPDYKGTTFLDNLDHLATQPLTPALAGRRGEILGDVIRETAEPTWYLNQGKVGTCAPTSLQTHLVLNSPSEYAGLISGLVSPDRSATLANGGTLQAARNDLDTSGMGQSVPDPADPDGKKRIPDTRSVTERMFQSALTQYAYRESGRQDSVNANHDVPGLNAEEQAAALSALYGRKYGAIEASGGGGGMGERWRESVTDKIQKELSQDKGPVPVSLKWGDGYHMVLVERIEKNKDGTMMVYFRNPWGSTDARGSAYKNGVHVGTLDNEPGRGPKRIVVDSQSGLEAVTLDSFEDKLRGAVVAK